MKYVASLIILFSITLLTSAQDVTATPPPAQINALIHAEFEVDNESPQLGEPFQVSIIITADPQIQILSWVDFTEPIEVLNEGEIESVAEGNMTRHTRTYEVVLWAVGDYLSEGALISYQSGGNVSSVPVSSFYVQVPIQISNPEDAVLRPSVPPIDLFYISPWVFVGFGLLVVIATMILSRLIQLSRQGVVQIVRASPAEKAIAELEDLKIQQLPASAIYEMVANNLRQYIEGQFEIEAVEMTTVELIGILRQSDIFPKNHRQRLQGVLEQADLVKFARFQPDSTSSLRLVNYAIKWLKDTERLQNRSDDTVS